MARYISDGNSDFDDGMKWVIVPPNERPTCGQLRDLNYDTGEELLDLCLPMYKGVPPDDPAPAAPGLENGGNASHAVE